MRVLLLLFAFYAVVVFGQIAMSPCIFGRATSGYSAPTGDNGNVGGTCGLAPAQPYLPPWYAQRYVAAPDDETYNGYPWVAPIRITDGGGGRSCGECFELTGDVGTIRVMSVDVCDAGCCSNCYGSIGGDLPDFDVDMAVLDELTSGSGNVPIAYRKVSCDMGGRTVGILFQASHYVRVRVYAQVVGIESVEVKGPSTGGTGGNWTPLTRDWLGDFGWTGSTEIGDPFNIRVTSILNETITFPDSFSKPYPSHTDSGLQFSAPPPGYGGGQTGNCDWPGPDPEIYVSGFGGPPLLKWRDWGSYTSSDPVYGETSGCHTSPCIRIPPSDAFGAMQIGTVVGAPDHYWDNLTFWVRSDTNVSIDVFWTNPSSEKVRVWAPTTWTQYNIPISRFWPSGSGSLKVVQFQFTTKSNSAVYYDDIQLEGANFNRLVPIIGQLNGPPPVGFPGYTGPDPLGGVPFVPGPPTGGGAAATIAVSALLVLFALAGLFIAF